MAQHAREIQMLKRVGIIAKPKLTAVSGDLPVIASWLQARGVEPVFEGAGMRVVSFMIGTSRDG